MRSSPPLSFSWTGIFLIWAITPLIPFIDRFHAWQARRAAAERDARWAREDEALRRAGFEPGDT